MLWWKAFHIIFVISWMAGLLYLFRIFVYHNEETEEVVRQRLIIMGRRLLIIITTPAGVLTVVSGFAMVFLNPSFVMKRWFALKLILVTVLVILNGAAFLLLSALPKRITPCPKWFLRSLNEVPTLLMIVIVLLVVLKP